MAKPDGMLLHLLQVARDRASEIGDSDVCRKIKAIIDDQLTADLIIGEAIALKIGDPSSLMEMNAVVTSIYGPVSTRSFVETIEGHQFMRFRELEVQVTLKSVGQFSELPSE